MEYVRFGSTGMKVSKLCLGCMTYGAKSWREWVLTEDESKPFFKAAFDAGINFYDTADVYSQGVSEEILGRAVKEHASRREEVVVATKVFNPMGKAPNLKGLSRKHIMEGIDASLQRLKMDYVDLYIIHRFDYDTEIEETLEALSDVVAAGKALYIGASSMWSWQFAKMLTLQKERGLARFASMQNYYNLVYREEEREMLPLCKEEKIAVTPWSPIARGFLAGSMPSQGEKTLRAQTDDFAKTLGIGATDTDYEIAERVRVTAEKLGVSRAAVAIAWTLANPLVTSPIIGASKPHHLPDALKALEIKFDDETKKFLEAPYRTRRPAGHA
ncbi:MAG: aldo/keto reductase [Xanthobacteraceae bacterium]|jgi:aryl-alcohol dehydrogenase-like predicted oxidoreductase